MYSTFSPPLSTCTNVLELVVGGHQLAGLGDGLQGELEFAGRFRSIGEVDRQQLAVGRGLDFLLGDDLHLARRASR